MQQVPLDLADVDPGASTLVGLIGRGIGLSRTPHMHETEAARLGLPLSYRLIDADEIAGNPKVGDLISASEQAGFAGLNVTYPFKIAAIDHLDDLSGNARAVGSVNTIVFRDGKRFGHNTDLWGFAEAFRQNMPDAARKKILLLGAGGAGGAVAHALADCGIETLVILDIDRARAAGLAERLSSTRPALITEVAGTDSGNISGLDGIVNATPVGMAKLPGMPIAAHLLHPQTWVADIIYFPLETELLHTARALGCQTMSGAPMAVFQAVRAFYLFTGLRPDFEQMRAAFNSRGTQ